jgi:hypothetical protein
LAKGKKPPLSTFIYLLSYLSCMTGPDTLQLRGVCAWADINGDGPVDLWDIALLQNDAGCIILDNLIRPEYLIEENCEP